MIPHRAVMANLAQICATYRIGREGGVFWWIPTFHNLGLVGGFLRQVYDRRPVTFMSPLAFIEKPSRWLHAITRLGATATGGPNFAYELCARALSERDCEGLDLSTLRVAACGSEPVRAASLDAFARRFERYGFQRSAFKPGFGLAEATMAASGPRDDAPPRVRKLSARALEQHRVEVTDAEGPAAGDPGRALVANGGALPGETLVVVDPERRVPCAPDQVGEIWLAGPNIAAGYWQRPEETAATFQAYLADGRGPFLRTGDLGFVQGGELFIPGRLKEMIIVRGHNHYPQDIEATVERCHPAVRPFGTAAFSVEVDDEERLGVAVELDPRVDASDAGQIIAAVRGAVAREHQLQVHAVLLVAAGALPRTASNKIQRHAVRDGYLHGSLPLAASSVLSGERPDAAREPRPGLTRAALLALPEDRQLATLESFVQAMVAVAAGRPQEAIRADAALASLGLDSLMVVQIKHALGSALELEIPIISLLEGPPLRDFARMLLEHARRAPPGTTPAFHLDERAATLTDVGVLAGEVSLPDDVAARGRSFVHAPAPAGVLVTGATGFVGAFLVAELLRSTTARLSCLVRAPDAEAGRARLRDAVRRFVALSPEELERVEVVVGDLEHERFGLEAAAFEALAERVQWIVHSGARVNFVYPYSALAPANVGGTREVLRLAATGPLKIVHHVSTVGVLMSGAHLEDASVAGEDAPLARSGRLANGYAQSKWVADALVALARERGIPCVTYRLGLVTGDSTTGRYDQLDEFLPRMLKGGIQLGRLPRLAGDALFVPVDYVARAIVAAARDPGATNHTIHLNHPRPMSVVGVIGWIADRGYAVQAVPFAQWHRELIEAIVERGQRDNALAIYLEYVLGLQEHQATAPCMSYANARRLLAAVPCVDLDVALARYFDYFVEAGFLPR
jgi:thioester reductase-like protein